MTVVPIGPWPVLLALAVAGTALIWWPGPQGVAEEPLSARWRRTAMVVTLFAASLRPGLPGDFVNASAANLNVYFVVDSTSSMIAEDYGGNHPRLDGVKDDIHAIARELTGARFALVTFDQNAKVRMPLSTDGLALDAAVDTLMPEANQYSRGSSITIAGPTIARLLEASAKKFPERGRLVFYFGDGERTATTPAVPIQLAPGLVQGGGVLGYGTTAGGPMRDTRSRYVENGATYIKDPATGVEAKSVLNEKNLQQVAQQLAVPYTLRHGADTIGDAMRGVDLTRFGTSQEVEEAKIRDRSEWYWWLLLALVPLAAWDSGNALASWHTGSSPRPSRPTRPVPPTGDPR